MLTDGGDEDQRGRPIDNRALVAADYEDGKDGEIVKGYHDEKGSGDVGVEDVEVLGGKSIKFH